MDNKNHLATYLTNWNSRDIPETEAKKQIQSISKDVFESWWDYHFSITPSIYEYAETLYKEFSNYCENNNINKPMYARNPQAFSYHIRIFYDAIKKSVAHNKNVWTSKKYLESAATNVNSNKLDLSELTSK